MESKLSSATNRVHIARHTDLLTAFILQRAETSLEVELDAEADAAECASLASCEVYYSGLHDSVSVLEAKRSKWFLGTRAHEVKNTYEDLCCACLK